jgi:hypothetical protein
MQRLIARSERPAWALLSLFLLSWCLAPTVAAAERGAAAASEKGDRAFQAGQWEKAAKAYRSVVEADPAQGLAWLRLGISSQQLGDAESALGAYQQALETGHAPGVLHLRAARAAADAGDAAACLEWMERAVAAGFGQGALAPLGEIGELGSDARFQALLKKAAENDEPCSHQPQYRQFDFWVGTWDVFNPQGQKAGTNRIEKSLDGCLVTENWSSAGGDHGSSMNYYDPQLGKWVQVWVDGGGGIIQVSGEFREGAMRFEGRHTLSNGTTKRYRMTFTPKKDGIVRQFIEESVNDGKTWYVWFDGTYVKQAG